MKSIPELSIDVKMLTDKLIALQVGQEVSYSDLSALIGADVRNGSRHKLHAAMNRALGKGIVIATVTGVGVKRLSDDEIVNTTEAFRRRLRRAAKKQARRLASVNFDKLPKNKQIDHNVGMATLAAITFMSNTDQQKKLTSHVANSGGERIPLMKTLEFFAKKP